MSWRDRRKGGGGGGGSGLSREVQVSKKLSWLLRHGAEKEGLKLGPGGYINVEEVLNSRSVRPLKVTFDELRAIVSDNDKQRFSLIPVNEVPSGSSTEPSSTSEVQVDSSNPAHFLIRANQGHTLKVDAAELLTPITTDNAPALVVHGTTRRAWPLILSGGGLKPMGRNHVHFATGLPTGFNRLVETSGEEQVEEPAPVISGMRNSSTVLIYVDLKKAIDMGLQFWFSANGVVLCDGGENGLVPVECFESVEDRGDGGTLLLKNGAVVGELSEKRKKKGAWQSSS